MTIQEASRELGVLRAEKQELEQQHAIFKEKEEHAHALFQESQTKLSMIKYIFNELVLKCEYFSPVIITFFAQRKKSEALKTFKMQKLQNTTSLATV